MNPFHFRMSIRARYQSLSLCPDKEPAYCRPAGYFLRKSNIHTWLGSLNLHYLKRLINFRHQPEQFGLELKTEKFGPTHHIRASGR